MKKETIFLSLIFSSIISYSQNVGIGTTSPDSSAALEIKSSSQGFLPPRMTTTQRNAVANPAVGLQIYNTTTDCLEIYAKGRWQNIYCATAAATPVNTDTTILTDIDGNAYPTVKICNQTWMQKNLSVSHYRNGDIIPQVTDYSQWLNLTTGAWCWYNNDSATYGSTYGKLYNWYAVNDPRGLSPEGWSIPTDSDWKKLIKCVDIQSDTNCFNCAPSLIAGNFLREIGTNHWLAPNTGASDLFNFKGLGAGYCNRDPYNSHFLDFKQTAFWWSKTQTDNNNAIAFDIGTPHSYCALFAHAKTFGFSVRCVKDTIPSSLTNGLVAYYPFNGNANDESGNGNNGLVNGATLTTDRFGNAGKAYSFNSNYSGHYSGNDYIRCLYPGPLGNSSRTFSFWIKTNVSNISSLNNTAISYGSNNVDGKEFRIVFGNDCGNGGMIVHNLSFNQQINYAPNDLWDYFTVVFNNALGNNMQGISIYKNGSLIQNYCTSRNGIDINTGSDSPLTFGRYHFLDWLPDAGFFKGSLDDIRIYNRALTQEEITYLATH